MLAGCAWLFGEMVPKLNAEGKPVYDDRGQPVMVYKEGALQKTTRAIAPVASAVPYGSAGLAVLTALGAIGTGIQTIRGRGKIEGKDMVKMVGALKDAGVKGLGDKHLGQLVAEWEPDGKASKLIKKAYDKGKKWAAKQELKKKRAAIVAAQKAARAKKKAARKKAVADAKRTTA
jgi:hypothetical protein